MNSNDYYKIIQRHAKEKAIEGKCKEDYKDLAFELGYSQRALAEVAEGVAEMMATGTVHWTDSGVSQILNVLKSMGIELRGENDA